MLDVRRIVMIQLHQEVWMEGIAVVFDSGELLARSYFQSEENEIVADYGIEALLLFETVRGIERWMILGADDEIWLLLQIGRRPR